MMSWTISISFSIYSFRLSLFSIFIISLQGTVLRITSLTIPEHDSHIHPSDRTSPLLIIFPSFHLQTIQRNGLLFLSYLLFILITHMGIYYISVVFELLCPNSSWIYRRSVPLPSRCLISLSFPMLHPKASRSDLFFPFHLLCE